MQLVMDGGAVARLHTTGDDGLAWLGLDGGLGENRDVETMRLWPLSFVAWCVGKEGWDFFVGRVGWLLLSSRLLRLFFFSLLCECGWYVSLLG